VPLFYADASALVKLILNEPESSPLRAFLADADLVSCELVLTEVPRALRRARAHDPLLPLDVLTARAGELLDALGLVPLDRALLAAAGAFLRADTPSPRRNPPRGRHRRRQHRRVRDV
jgi:predicted nucleic acid-binding protein